MAGPVTVDVRPGYYLENQTVTVSFDSSVKDVAINKDGTPPSISKLIAYDNLNPPQPFIAVTEDGAGRVVYDGSFPKLYNSQFDVTTGSRKYLFNAIEWIMDSNRDRKVLFLGDANLGESYNIKGTASSDFLTSINKIIATAGYTGSVIKTASDYAGNRLDARYSELAQYGAVFILGSTAAMPPRMTDRCRDDIVRYRESGGGVLLMSDSSPPLPTIQDAINHGITGAGGHFSGIINKVATRFGAWMTDLLNRNNVPLKYIRDNFGDHELYNGIGDDEVIAGGSDSIVRVTSDPVYPPSQVQTVYTTKLGHNVINIMVILNDGQMVPVKLEYNIVDYKVVFVINGEVCDSGALVSVGASNAIRLKVETRGVTPNLNGLLKVNAQTVASVSSASGSVLDIIPTRADVYPGTSDYQLHISDDSLISVVFTSPAGMEVDVVIKRPEIPYAVTKDLSWPLYDQLMEQAVKGTTAAQRFKLTLAVGHNPVDVPLSIDGSKKNLVGPYMTMPVTHKVTIAGFDAPSRYYGFYSEIGGGGSVTPSVFSTNINGGIKTAVVRDINSTIAEPLMLQLGSFSTLYYVNPVAVYIDEQGPFYRSRYNNGDAGVFRSFYSDGVFNIHEYLKSKNGKVVDFRFIYSEVPLP